MANTSATQHNRRVLPVAGWLQVGAAAAGIGIALAAAPAAAADTETGSSTSGSVSISARSAPSNGQTTQRRAATRERPALSTADRWATTALSTADRWATTALSTAERGATTASSGATRAAAAVDRPSRSSIVSRAASAPAAVEVPDSGTIAAAAAPTTLPPAVRSIPASRIRTGVTAPADAAALNMATLPLPTASATADSPVGNFLGDVAAFFGLPGAPATTAESPVGNFLGDVAAFFGLPGAPATTAPTIGALPLFTRLVIDDVLGGSAPPANLDSTTVITGLFREIMRKDPTAGEIQSYSTLWNLTGINGVVAGLYSSTAFRQNQVDSYYLELLGRTATRSEKSWGATSLIWGLPEPLFAASIAGSREYYAASNAGGGPDGPSPSAVSFVDLLYRTLVGATPDPVLAPAYVQQVQAGLPTGLVSLQFVTTESFRQVKVLETFQVLGLSPTPEVVADYVDRWFLYGGLAGISTLLLASGENAVRIEQGLVELPDMVAAAQLQQLLLAPYSDGTDGFYALFNQFFNNPTKDVNCKKTPDNCANPGLYELLTIGGVSRGIPNGAISVQEMAVPVAGLIPNQNEISLRSSLGFPLGRDPEAIRTAFKGGNVKVADQLILTSADGQYIVDGHHRWSQLFLINPFANIDAADVGYVPNPKEALMQTQVAIAARTGFLDSQNAGNDNLFTISQESFNGQVAKIIDDGRYPDSSPITPGEPTKPAVLEIFTEFLGLDGQTDTEKMDSIENYLWSNVLRMRESNFYITDAPGRPVMPQTSRSTFQPVLDLMQGPSPLSYSFPIISYLG